MATPAHITTLKNVMLSAWRLFRDYRDAPKPLTFAKALKQAWAREKRANKAADAFLAKARAQGGRVSFGSPIYSPTSRVLTGSRYAGFADRQAGRSISAVAR